MLKLNFTKEELVLISKALNFTRDIYPELEEYENEFDEDKLIEVHTRILIQLGEF